MQVSISSDNYRIIDSRQVFLFSETSDLRIDIALDDDSDDMFSVVLSFSSDDSRIEKIESSVDGNILSLVCYNLSDLGTGLSEPINIAAVKDKKMYLQFW